MSETEGEGLDLVTAGEGDDEEQLAWPPETLELTLRKPVQFGEEFIQTLALREPTGEEWEEIHEHPLKTRRRFAVSTVAKVPLGVTAKMVISDLVRAERYLYAFFEVGQAIKDW